MSGSFITSNWQLLRQLFDQALELDDEARAALVRQTAEQQPELAQALSELLHSHNLHSGQTTEQRARILRAAVATIDSPLLARGARIGAYELREELGRGGMGVVFRAERVDGKISHEVAIKIVQGRLLDENGLRRFQQERDIVAGFQHPFIGRLYDVGETPDGSPYLVMELIKGEAITDYCDRRQLPIRKRLVLFLDVCEAVQHAHARLILHRDIKPANVLVTGDGVPKLIDFGIAKSIELGSEAERTGTQQRFFSPTNAAPEQIRGERAGAACDVYQLGTLLYELLSGATVFNASGLTPGQIEELIVEHVPDAPSAQAALATPEILRARSLVSAAVLRRRIKGDLDSIVLQALRKAPAERYASVDQMANDIRRHLANEPVAAQRSQFGYRLRKFLRRNRFGAALALAAALVVAAFIVTILQQSQRLQLERDAAMEANWDTAFRAIEQKAISDGDNARLNYLRAQNLWRQQGSPNAPLQASRLLKLAVQQDPKLVDAYRLMAQIALEQLDIDGAEKAVAQAKALGDRSDELTLDEAKLALLRKDPATALAILRELADSTSANPATVESALSELIRLQVPQAEPEEINALFQRYMGIQGEIPHPLKLHALIEYQVFGKRDCAAGLATARALQVPAAARFENPRMVAAALVCRAAELAQVDAEQAYALYHEATAHFGVRVPELVGEFIGAPPLGTTTNETAIRFLASKGVNLNRPGHPVWETPISKAIIFHDLSALALLLDLGSDPNAASHNGHLPLDSLVLVTRSDLVTPQHTLPVAKQVAMARLLMQHGADPDKRSPAGGSPRYRLAHCSPAVRQALLPIFGRPIVLSGTIAFDPGPDECSPLCRAIATGDKGLVGAALAPSQIKQLQSELIAGGSVLDEGNALGYQRYQPINVAIRMFNEDPDFYAETIRSLVAAGADPSIRDPDGKNANDLVGMLDGRARRRVLPLLAKQLTP